MSLRRQFASSASWTLLSNAGQQLITFVLFLILARNLSAADFGTMALAAVMLDFALYLVGFGQVELAQSRRDDAPEALSESFFITTGAGIAALVVLVALAKPMAALFGAPDLVGVLYVIAPCCLITALGVTQEGVLRRQFGYRALAFRNIVSTLVGGVAAIVVMVLGYGVLALAAQRLVKAIVMTATMWLASAWRPSARFDRAAARRLAQHGARIASATFLTMAGPRTVDLLIGYLLGTAQLGYVRVAFRIFDFVSQFIVLPFSSVALSTFSRQKEDREAALTAFLKVTQITTGVLVPVLFGIGALGGEIVSLLLGDKWLPTVPLIQILSTIAVAAPLNYLFSPLMLSIEATAVVLRQSVLQLVAGLVLAAAAAPMGLAAILVAHVTRSYIVFGYNILAIRAALGLTLARAGRALAPFVVSGLVMLGVIWLTRLVVQPSAELVVIVSSALTGAAAYLATLYLGERLGWWQGVLPLINESLAMVSTAYRSARPATATPTAPSQDE